MRRLPARAWGLCFAPTAEWELIAAEPATTRSLMLGYAAPMAALPALAEMAGHRLFSFGEWGGRHGAGLAPAIATAVTAWVFSLATVLVLARLIGAMAPDFGGIRDWVAALKVAVYASTIGWVTGLAAIFPPLAIVGGLCAALEAYPIYVGLPRLMAPPANRSVAFVAVVFVAAMLLLLASHLAAGWVGGIVTMVWRA